MREADLTKLFHELLVRFVAVQVDLLQAEYAHRMRHGDGVDGTRLRGLSGRVDPAPKNVPGTDLA
jgi:hypothetical protein